MVSLASANPRLSALATSLCLGVRFDVHRLRADVEALRHVEPVRHHDRYHDGGWYLHNLISRHGDPNDVDGGGECRPSLLLEKTPYVRSVLDELPGRKGRVRFMHLLPGARIRPHYDRGVSIDEEVARMHVPIITHPRARLSIGGHACRFSDGELWYGDFSFPHHARNAGTITRVHLVIDLVVDDGVRALFPESYLKGAPIRSAARCLLQGVNRLAGSIERLRGTS